MIVAFTVDSTWLVVGWLRWAAAIGLGIGVAIGISEARAVDSAIEAERAELQAEHLEAQRDLLEYLNSLLRHEVLNSVNVISGYASLLQEEHPSESRSHEYGETIEEQSQDMSQVIHDVRVLLDATHGTATFDPVNLSEILREEVKKVDRTYDTAEIDASIPDDVLVPADRLLRRVFGNLLSNAVEHNDSETPVISVTVTTTPETVRIEIADNGSGIPDTAAETLFTRPETGRPDHGVGLYLVGKLVENYRGRIDLTESGSNGSVFTVELPRVSSENSGSGGGVSTAFTLTDAEHP
ncbi:HAMP domain-containing sensor histidine kinase [Natronomonas gomsonensis]|uniref:sensor histidine kinase n=1 Tax=Natronomonas gomsonensis TaxID=1046043 RepID=UPI0032B255DF